MAIARPASIGENEDAGTPGDARTMLKESRQRRVYADHNQFYIVDSFPFRYSRKPAFPGDPGGGALWNPQEFQDRMAAIPGMVAVSTGSYGFVQVIIEL